MAEGNEQALQGDQSLAMLLGFLARLEESQHKDKVIESIKEKVKDYISNKLTEFADEGGTSGFLPKTIENSKELRRNIVLSEDTYKHYTQSFDSDGLNDEQYSELLIDHIFPLFGCLYYMYYECSQQCNSIEGSKWWQDKCDGTGGRGQDRKNLNQWLTDQKGGKTHIVSRGFQQEELSSTTGSELFASGSSRDGLLHYAQGGHLQNALFFMLFLPSDTNWNNAQSGHAVLFLETFCQMVKEGKFQDKYNDNGDSFKKECQKVVQNIKTLTGLKIIVPVALYQEVKYETLLEVTHFWKYIGWLKENLQGLITSLKEMTSDMNNWKEEELRTSKSFGPYFWGFTFEYNWNSKTGQLNGPLQNLTQTLQSLQSALDKIEHVSYAATIGKVAGGLGAAAATGAAAYAGSGFVGPVAESIGRFFRGLLF